MARWKKDLDTAKSGYNDARDRGDREEEARWANQIGHLYKEHGEYVEALKWFRIDYDISLKDLPKKQLMPTCQSIGEIYLRLSQFEDALVFQKKHLKYAEKADDLVEQQRASTQLGRTFFDIYEEDEDNYFALEEAKKYLKVSLELARTLKLNPPSRNSPSFVKELVDAYNNMGLLKIYVEDYNEAERILFEGMRICDDEEVGDNDEGRTRLHHNLGRIYMELREWEKAKEHVNIDIAICQNIPHPQGEANGLINLGLIHYKLQMYDDALSCYKRALTIARTLEDEDALVASIKVNIETTEEAKNISETLKQEEQQLKKLSRDANLATGSQRRNQIKLHKCLKQLIELATNIEAWPKCLVFAKKSKNVVKGLRDMEKLSDAFHDIGEAYYNLRNFSKAKKWYMKSWKASKAIRNLEGQAVAKINIGNALDSAGEWAEALEAYQEGYETAVQGNVHSSQITALQNMHYSYMLRFDNVEEARKLEPNIKRLKKIMSEKGDDNGPDDERCSETESELGNAINSVDENWTEHSSPYPVLHRTPDRSHVLQQDTNDMSGQRANTPLSEDDLPLASYLCSRKMESQKRKAPLEMWEKNKCQTPKSLKENRESQEKVNNDILQKVVSNEQLVGFKRSRIILSDDDTSNDSEESCINPHMKQVNISKKPSSIDKSRQGTVDTSSNDHILQPPHEMDKLHPDRITSKNIISVRIGETIVTVDARGSNQIELNTIDWLKVEVVQVYCLQHYIKNKSPCLKPIVQELAYNGNILKSSELVTDLIASLCPGDVIDAVLDGWVQIPLAERYTILCKGCNQAPNHKLLRKLYNLKVSEDEVVASDCELHDVSVVPLLKALADGTFALLDLSHNSLGNQTLHSIPEIIAVSNERDLGLTLDLHNNQLGASALRQICQCSVSLSRLEVLNLSGNRLTDACGRHLAAVIEGSKALAILNLEDCALTSRTIERITNALPLESGLVKLSIGKNPISGNSLSDLLKKLSMLKSFSDLDLTNVELKKASIESLCHLLQSSSSISSLAIGSTSIGMDGAMKISGSLAKGESTVTVLDMSFCGVDLHGEPKICRDFISHESLLQLNLSGNALEEKGVSALLCLLQNAHCHLKVLMVSKCCLGQTGILKILQSLSENRSLQELGLAGNNTAENDPVFNIVVGGDGTSVACHGEEVVNAAENYGECSKINTRLKSIQIEIPISVEHMAFEDCVNYNSTNGASDRISRTHLTEFNCNSIFACGEDKNVNAKEHGNQQIHKKLDKSCDEYEVADSEDEGRPENVNHSFQNDCISSPHSPGVVVRSHLLPGIRSDKNVPSKGLSNAYRMSPTEYASELSSAIRMAKHLQRLDLSDNLFPSEMAELLYVAWSSTTRAGAPIKHLENQIVHFSVEGRKCCGFRLCCQRLN